MELTKIIGYIASGTMLTGIWILLVVTFKNMLSEYGIAGFGAFLLLLGMIIFGLGAFSLILEDEYKRGGKLIIKYLHNTWRTFNLGKLPDKVVKELYNDILWEIKRRQIMKNFKNKTNNKPNR